MQRSYTIRWKHCKDDGCVLLELADAQGFLQAAAVFADDHATVQREVQQMLDYANFRDLNVTNPKVISDIISHLEKESLC